MWTLCLGPQVNYSVFEFGLRFEFERTMLGSHVFIRSMLYNPHRSFRSRAMLKFSGVFSFCRAETMQDNQEIIVAKTSGNSTQGRLRDETG